MMRYPDPGDRCVICTKPVKPSDSEPTVPGYGDTAWVHTAGCADIYRAREA